MNTQFKKGIIELCVLSEINRKDMYGYEVVHELSKFIDVNENTIYPILRRLTKENNFSTFMQQSSEGPPRKYYSITQQGRGRYLDMKEEWEHFNANVHTLLNRGEANE